MACLNDISQIWWQWMVGMSWQVSLLIILVAILDLIIRRRAWPQVRYVLWGLVFLKLMIPPTWQMQTSIVSWIQPHAAKLIPNQTTPGNAAAGNQSSSKSGIHPNTVAATPPIQITRPIVTVEKPTWKTIGLLFWFAGIIAFALILNFKMLRLPKRSQFQDGHSIPEWFAGLLVGTAQNLKLRKIPAIIFSKSAKSPAVYGIFRPILLLPEGSLNRLTKEQAEHILIHELCHLKRGDLLVHWFCLILQIIYWFNPLLVWTRRQMRHVCEICCDLSVAELLREKTQNYRETLLVTARELLAETVETSLGLLGVFEEPFKLAARLQWLEKKTWGNSKRKLATVIGASLIMAIGVMPMAGVSQSAGQRSHTPGTNSLLNHAPAMRAPLQIAALNGSKNMPALPPAGKRDVSAKNKGGPTPSPVARAENRLNAMELLTPQSSLESGATAPPSATYVIKFGDLHGGLEIQYEITDRIVGKITNTSPLPIGCRNLEVKRIGATLPLLLEDSEVNLEAGASQNISRKNPFFPNERETWAGKECLTGLSYEFKNQSESNKFQWGSITGFLKTITGYEIELSLENDSDQPIIIDWNGSSFTGVDHSTSGIINHKGWPSRYGEISSIVSPRSTFHGVAIPSKNIVGGCSDYGVPCYNPLIPSLIAPELAGKIMNNSADNKISFALQLIIEGKKMPVTLDFEIKSIKAILPKFPPKRPYG
jgi:beta-lactamase regulating signal transducer with metallopeptidase domain